MNLHTIVYSSRETKQLSMDEAESLLQKARQHNDGADITGLLLYFDYVFVQVLEGPEDEIRALYERIIADDRHKDITLHIDEPLQSRLFGDWSMAYTVTDRETISQTDNVVALFRDKSGQRPALAMNEQETRITSLISLIAKTMAA